MKKNTGVKILIVVLIIFVIIAGILIAMKFINKKDNNTQISKEPEPIIVEEKKITIVDENSKSRPYAIMINNNHSAWPQCGLQDAYLVYEIIVEGGISRMMAIYKDQETAKIGSVRSARHYFIDYAEENDAIYIHWGGSPQAYSRLSQGIDDIDGIAAEGTAFFRDTSLKRDYEHTGFTSLAKLKDYAENKGYTRNTNKDLLLNYSADEIELSEKENAEKANSITLKYSNYQTTSYEYDETNKVYKRSMSNKENVDLVTGEQYTTKNILVYKVENYQLDSYGRQELKNIGTGTGYYITNGYAIPINWSKKSHSGQTTYTYESGEEIDVNDGNTFIQICPLDSTITIE